jgi:hypothetical protein
MAKKNKSKEGVSNRGAKREAKISAQSARDIASHAARKAELAQAMACKTECAMRRSSSSEGVCTPSAYESPARLSDATSNVSCEPVFVPSEASSTIPEEQTYVQMDHTERCAPKPHSESQARVSEAKSVLLETAEPIAKADVPSRTTTGSDDEEPCPSTPPPTTTEYIAFAAMLVTAPIIAPPLLMCACTLSFGAVAVDVAWGYCKSLF